MIILYKNNHFCELSIKRDLLGLWEVVRKSGCATWPSVHVDVFPCSNEQEAKLKLFDLEVGKRSQGFNYGFSFNKIKNTNKSKSKNKNVQKPSKNLEQHSLFGVAQTNQEYYKELELK